ncbi:MAG: LLM class flavin-dependent oxidoreductase, partial [Candidatus Woesearchaeota archaeon]
IARETNRCIIGTSVTDCFRLNTGVLAQAAMTLQNLSNGRFILGIGMGEAQNITPYGISYNRKISRLSETVICLKKLWHGEPVSYRGEFVTLDRATIKPKPSHLIPVWIAANSSKTIELTGKIGDGWLPLAVRFPPEQYANSLNIIKRYVKDFSQFEPALFIHTLCNKNRENAWRQALEGGKLMLVMWVPEIFEKYGHTVEPLFHADKLIFDDKTIHLLKKKLKELPDEPVYQRLTVGNPDDCISSLEKYVKAGVRHFVLSFLTSADQLAESIKFYKEKVISYFWGR